MEEKYSKKTLVFVQICIYAVVFICLARNNISLVLSGVAATFPEASTTLVQTVYSVISTGAIIGSLIAGKLAQIFHKKWIMVVDLLLGCGAAMVAYFFGNTIGILKVCSVVIGLTFGQFVPLTGALIAEYFEGQQRASVVGLRVVFMNGGGIVLTLLAGQLANTYWKNTYLLFLLSVPVALLCIFLLPKGQIETAPIKENGEKVGFFEKYMNPWLALILLMVVIQGIGYACYLSNVSFSIKELGLGGTKQASYMSTIMQMASIFAGFIMVPLVKLFKKSIPGAGILGMGLSFIILANAKGFPMLALGAVVFGITVQMFANATVAIMPENVPAGSMTMSLALFNCLMNLGLTVHPYLVTLPASKISDTTVTRYYICAVIMFIGGLIGLTIVRKLTKEVNVSK